MSLPVPDAVSSVVGARRRRPAVLDASRTALIPLRPLSIGEILDGAFLIVRRNVRLMLGLPLVIAGAAALYVLAGIGAWVGLGNTTWQIARIVLLVGMGLLGLFGLVQCVVWMTAILSRVSLQTVLGDGFAPSVSAVTLRSSLSMFWPVLGLSLLVSVALGVVQTAMSVLYNIAVFGTLAVSPNSEAGTLIAAGIMSLLTFAVLMAALAYLSLTVPALSVESRRSPAWIGKPARPTNVITAFARSFQLIGRPNLLRVIGIFGGTALICAGVLLLTFVGSFLVLLLYADTISLDIYRLLTNPWVITGVSVFSMLLALSALIAYVSAVLTLTYLDLRMRREGLDLAMRFDCMPIPQPSAPPPVYPPGWLPAYPGPPVPPGGVR